MGWKNLKKTVDKSDNAMGKYKSKDKKGDFKD